MKCIFAVSFFTKMTKVHHRSFKISEHTVISIQKWYRQNMSLENTFWFTLIAKSRGGKSIFSAHFSMAGILILETQNIYSAGFSVFRPCMVFRVFGALFSNCLLTLCFHKNVKLYLAKDKIFETDGYYFVHMM